MTFHNISIAEIEKALNPVEPVVEPTTSKSKTK